MARREVATRWKTMSFNPRIAPEVLALRPDYRALSLLADGVPNAARHAASDAVIEAVRAARPWPPYGDAHLESWREAYRAFGAKPQRTPSSVEALAKRLRNDGQLPEINAVVDLYNALSVRHAIPIGGENVDAYVGSPLLRLASGDESFDTMKDGAPFLEPVPAGEVVWTDERGVTCRRWNWRQGVRTRIELSTTRMWFVLERLEPMPIAALHEAGELLAATLRMLDPGVTTTSAILPA